MRRTHPKGWTCSRRKLVHKIRGFLPGVKVSKSNESRHNGGFEFNHPPCQIPLGHPVFGQAINKVTWRGSAITKAGYFYLSGTGIFKGRNKSSLGIMGTHAPCAGKLLIFFY